MSIYDDLPAKPPMSRVWRGRFTTPLPAQQSDLATVIIIDMAQHLKIGGVAWAPRFDILPVDVSEGLESPHLINVPQLRLPAVGDLCLLVFDNNRAPWAVTWWPYAYEV
jgi:hypothetical protein